MLFAGIGIGMLIAALLRSPAPKTTAVGYLLVVVAFIMNVSWFSKLGDVTGIMFSIAVATVFLVLLLKVLIQMFEEWQRQRQK